MRKKSKGDDDEEENHLNYLIDKEISCVEYSPDVFAKLREMDNITLKDLQNSLNPDFIENVKRIEKAGQGMGKSGSFFFFSHDNNFIIKTMSDDDYAAF